jgi:hypothetical protein
MSIEHFLLPLLHTGHHTVVPIRHGMFSGTKPMQAEAFEEQFK